jgi:hypothetical protein
MFIVLKDCGTSLARKTRDAVKNSAVCIACLLVRNLLCQESSLSGVPFVDQGTPLSLEICIVWTRLVADVGGQCKGEGARGGTKIQRALGVRGVEISKIAIQHIGSCACFLFALPARAAKTRTAAGECKINESWTS